MIWPGVLHSIGVCTLLSVTYGLQSVEVFRDDFNGKNLSAKKWNRVNVASTVNGELQYYTPDNAYLDSTGHLILRSQKKDFGGRAYTSGRVDTRNKFSFKYGEVEWRAKLPKGGKGIWPALWLLRPECPAAVACPAGFWPPEIDVLEAHSGDLPNTITSTVHFGVFPKNSYVEKAFVGPDFTAGFHTFKVLWDPNKVVFYVDGKETSRLTDKSKIPSSPLYLIMNTAIGGNYPGNPDYTTKLPAEFVIDYVSVRRWQ